MTGGGGGGGEGCGYGRVCLGRGAYSGRGACRGGGGGGGEEICIKGVGGVKRVSESAVLSEKGCIWLRVVCQVEWCVRLRGVYLVA